MVVELLIDERWAGWSLSGVGLDVASTSHAVAGVHSAVKNLGVIPIYLVALLQTTRIIPAGSHLPALPDPELRQGVSSPGAGDRGNRGTKAGREEVRKCCLVPVDHSGKCRRSESA